MSTCICTRTYTCTYACMHVLMITISHANINAASAAAHVQKLKMKLLYMSRHGFDMEAHTITWYLTNDFVIFVHGFFCFFYGSISNMRTRAHSRQDNYTLLSLTLPHICIYTHHASNTALNLFSIQHGPNVCVFGGIKNVFHVLQTGFFSFFARALVRVPIL